MTIKRIETCECGGKLVGEEAITPLTDDNVRSWHRLWYDIAVAVEKGAKFCEQCRQICHPEEESISHKS